MSDEVREELQGFIESWRDDAAKCRETAGQFGGTRGAECRAVAECYDECADELEAMLERAKATTN